MTPQRAQQARPKTLSRQQVAGILRQTVSIGCEPPGGGIRNLRLSSMSDTTEHAQSSRLVKNLKPHWVWAIALGSAVGWGAFILPADWMGTAGPLGALLGLAIGGGLMIIVGVSYGFPRPGLPSLWWRLRLHPGGVRSDPRVHLCLVHDPGLCLDRRAERLSAGAAGQTRPAPGRGAGPLI